MPSFEPTSGRISRYGSSFTAKRFSIHADTASRNAGKPSWNA